jgi:hypothetical protein
MTLRYAHLIPSQRHEVIKAIFDGVGWYRKTRIHRESLCNAME